MGLVFIPLKLLYFCAKRIARYKNERKLIALGVLGALLLSVQFVMAMISIGDYILWILGALYLYAWQNYKSLRIKFQADPF